MRGAAPEGGRLSLTPYWRLTRFLILKRKRKGAHIIVGRWHSCLSVYALWWPGWSDPDVRGGKGDVMAGDGGRDCQLVRLKGDIPWIGNRVSETIEGVGVEC